MRSQQVVNEHFTSAAPFWNDVYQAADAAGQRYRQRLELVLRWFDRLVLPAGTRILDVGAGAGWSSVAVAARGFRVDAIEPVEAMLELIRANARAAGVAERVEAETGDVHALVAAAATYDVVLALGVVPWLHSPRRALEEIVRVLKPGGYAIVSCDNRAALAGLLDPMRHPALDGLRRAVSTLLRRLDIRKVPAQSVRAHLQSLRSFDRLIESVGLTRLRGQTYGFGPFSFMNRSLPDVIDLRLQAWLQRLLDNGMPLIGNYGAGYCVLAQRLTTQPSPGGTG
ncbi:MAG TPA: methyltransferase domain-containing protein [Candidatus Dormibacteraeota bacterium]|nr:methyltransferase domain-containing protein [Candidatus Dormibacteraeota bacterium]